MGSLVLLRFLPLTLRLNNIRMARPLTPQSLNTILGGSTIVVVVLISAYLFLALAKVDAQAPVATQYNLTAINKDLQAPDDSNVFLKTTILPSAQKGDSTVVTYQSTDIGKTDLTQLNK